MMAEVQAGRTRNAHGDGGPANRRHAVCEGGWQQGVGHRARERPVLQPVLGGKHRPLWVPAPETGRGHTDPGPQDTQRKSCFPHTGPSVAGTSQPAPWAPAYFSHMQIFLATAFVPTPSDLAILWLRSPEDFGLGFEKSKVNQICIM